MKIKLENLGPIRQAELSLSDFTILSGLNNTGKTYITYAIYGFLKLWRKVINIDTSNEDIQQLLTSGSIQIDLLSYVSKAQKYVDSGCKVYSKLLPIEVFGSSEKVFGKTDFRAILEDKEIDISNSYHGVIRAVNVSLFSLDKQENDNYLTVTLLVPKESQKLTKENIQNVISNAIKNILFASVFPTVFIASAERTGSAIFRKELNFARNRLLEEMAKSGSNVDPRKLLFSSYQDYALPVQDNVEFVRNIEGIAKSDSFLAQEFPDILDYYSEIIGGKYIISRNDELLFEPISGKIKLTMDESSSAVRSLLDVSFYLKHLAKKGDLLMVDEPELNLHPENQRKVARLLAALVNFGIKVFITTHSDYILKELNTLIMLGQGSERIQKIAETEGYNDFEILNVGKICAYSTKKSLLKVGDNKRKTKCLTLVKSEITQELGIEAESFDESIDEMNRIQEEIIWGG